MTPSEGELFKKILGSEWARLHPDIQRRFDKNPAPGDIRIEIRHALFGLPFLQAGVFHEHAESVDGAATGEAA